CRKHERPDLELESAFFGHSASVSLAHKDRRLPDAGKGLRGRPCAEGHARKAPLGATAVIWVIPMSEARGNEMNDGVVVGAGHNGLVAALLLARKGLRVCVLEDQPVVGGAVRTERPFAKVPKLGTSTGAYLLGLMPPELLRKLEIDVPVRRR